MQLKDAKLFRQQAYVDGAWVDADNGQTIKVNNPATGEIIGSVPKMGAAETRRAIEAADKALPAWRALTAKERANKLRRWFDLMIENQDDLARLMTIRQGKPLAGPRARSPTPPPSSNGSAKKPSASTATPFPATSRTSASS